LTLYTNTRHPGKASGSQTAGGSNFTAATKPFLADDAQWHVFTTNFRTEKNFPQSLKFRTDDAE